VPLDLLWSDRRGELDVLVVMVRSPTTPDLAVALRPRSTCRSYTRRGAGRSWTKPNDASLSRCAERFDLVVCWCERCYVLGILDEFRIIGTGPRVGL